MLNFSGIRRVFIARGPQDMRRGIDSLSSAVVSELGQDPYAGDCFVFLGRDRRRLKALVWEDGGFWLCMKRLEAGTFLDPARWCLAGAVSVAVTPAQMHEILEGIDVKKASYRVRQQYRSGNPQSFIKCKHGRPDSQGRVGADAGRGHGQSQAGVRPADRTAEVSPGCGEITDRGAVVEDLREQDRTERGDPAG